MRAAAGYGESVGFLAFLGWLGGLAFLVGFLLTVALGRSGKGVAAVAVLGLLASGGWIVAVIATAPSEPMHETVKTFGRHVSPLLLPITFLNLLAWFLGVGAGWATRQAPMMGRRSAERSP